ncbi:uncharacterized protein LOC110892926 [Helianthus annuus]|uniref:uncharacterized protein LOC110892926 n=1 Tax=Helianthus annuus TaxID=4232 RepID=UPI000B907081|nr:uncharacterized protein LOC110892926 [Helianthus annuus]
MSNLDPVLVGRYWGQADMEWDFVDAIGRSGGIVSTWDPGIFSKQDVIKNESFLVVTGRIAGSNITLNVVNVYASCDVVRRRELWDELKRTKGNSEGLWIMIGDFNEVREEVDRMISRFDSHGAMIFNSFIAEAGLLEYQMGGYKYTYMPDDGSSLSKIDRLLVCDDFMCRWPTAKFEALSRHLSDHSPLVLTCVSRDFGPIPFRFYNSWLETNGIDEVVRNVMEGNGIREKNMKELAYILKKLKEEIKKWRKESKAIEDKEIAETMKGVEDIERAAENRRLTTSEKEKRIKRKVENKRTRKEKVA